MRQSKADRAIFQSIECKYFSFIVRQGTFHALAYKPAWKPLFAVNPNKLILGILSRHPNKSQNATCRVGRCNVLSWPIWRVAMSFSTCSVCPRNTMRFAPRHLSAKRCKHISQKRVSSFVCRPYVGFMYAWILSKAISAGSCRRYHVGMLAESEIWIYDRSSPAETTLLWRQGTTDWNGGEECLRLYPFAAVLLGQ